MKPTKISVNFGITKNMGNYESLRLDYQMDVDLGPGEMPGTTIDEAREYLRLKMLKDLEESNGGRDLLKSQ